MTRKARTQMNEQGRAFIKKARELECDEDPAAFDRMFSRIAPPKRPKDRPSAQKPPSRGRTTRSEQR